MQRGGGGDEAMEPGGVVLQRVITLFEENCAAFAHLVINADEVADATDFTGKLHDLSLTAGRVQGLGAALATFTGDTMWHTRARAALREYLEPSTPQDEGGPVGEGYADGRGALGG